MGAHCPVWRRPAAMEALDRLNVSIDVREVLPVISVPALVVHQRADPWVRVEHGRYLAEHIPGAAYVELDGDEHILTAPAARQVLAQMIPFLREAAVREAPEPDKVLATILFSDLVGSTGEAGRAGRPLDGGTCCPSIMHGCRGELARFRGARDRHRPRRLLRRLRRACPGTAAPLGDP